MQERVVTKNEAGQRFDKLLAKYLRLAPQGFLYKMLRKKNITLNGKKASGSEKVEAGDVVRFFLSDETMEKFMTHPPKGQLFKGGSRQIPDILYEDEHILLFNKPVGLLSQKSKEADVSAVELLITYLLETGQIKKEELDTFRPSVCNRLDRNTSGILAAGKSLAGLQELSRFFKERTVEKYYLCLVAGRVEEEQTIDGWLKKNEKTNKVQVFEREIAGGDRIQTAYQPVSDTLTNPERTLARSASDTGRPDVHTLQSTLLKVHLITGKPHQIRAHLASIGHPIIGDYKYGNKKINDRYRDKYGLNSQLLHAYELVMPKTDQTLSYLSGRTFTAEVPTLFREVCSGEGISIPDMQGSK